MEFNQMPLYAKIKVKYIDEDTLLKLYEQWSQQYYMDGLVIYVNDLDIWKKLAVKVRLVIRIMLLRTKTRISRLHLQQMFLALIGPFQNLVHLSQ